MNPNQILPCSQIFFKKENPTPLTNPTPYPLTNPLKYGTIALPPLGDY